MQARRGTLAAWTASNPTPLEGEICFVTDQNKVKIGNGTDNFNTLPYLSAVAVPQSGANDPNGVNTGNIGEIFTQVVGTAVTIWVNTDGAMAWS